MGYSQDSLDSGESTSGKSADIVINCQADLSLGSSKQLDTEGGASNEVIDDVDGNDNGIEVLSDWIIDELEKMCYYTDSTYETILDSSGSHDNAYEAAVMQHQSTEGNGVDLLRELPEVALQELFDYYCNEDSYSTTTTTSTTTNSIATEREEAMTEYSWFSF